jgi:hypothetical protein
MFTMGGKIEELWRLHLFILCKTKELAQQLNLSEEKMINNMEEFRWLLVS